LRIRTPSFGWTALHQAAYSDQWGLAQELLDRGAPTDLFARGDGGRPLVVALF
jgi:ankyrin repeat protein